MRSRQLRRKDDGGSIEVESGVGSTPAPSSEARLQRAMGNQGLQAALAEAAGRPHGSDSFEREADAFAVGGGSPAAQGTARGGTSRAERELVARLGSGQALSSALRTDLEARLGQPLAGVRVHRGESAAELAHQAHARAFTSGAQIVLGEGASESDAALMAHESAHVAQQASAAAAPAVQCQPAAAGPDFDALLLSLQQWFVNPLSAFNPPQIRAELLSLAMGPIPFGTVEITRLATAPWSSNRSERADSVWRPDGTPEIGVSDDLLRDFAHYDQDRDSNVDAGWAVVRTIAHELRHLNRFKEREKGTRGATIAEKRFEKEATALAAATPNKLTLQEYVQLPPGRQLHHDTVYPYEEVLARLEEVPFIEREYNSLRARGGGASQGDREHIEAVLCETGYNAQVEWQEFLNSCNAGKAGLSPADIATAIREIEAEIAKRFAATSQAPKRFWELIKAGRFSSRYPSRAIKQVAPPGGAPGEYIFEGEIVIVFLPIVLP